MADTVLALAAGTGTDRGAGRVRAVAEAWASGSDFHRTRRAAGARNLKDGRGESDGQYAESSDAEAAESNQLRALALALISSLTKRQRTIVAQAATGASSREIARNLDIKVRTVEGHLYQIYQRVNVGSRNELRQLFARTQASATANGATARHST